MRARFVVRVSRKNADSVRIDLLAGSGSETYHGGRDLAFAPEDGKADRGRAIGLVIAELLRSSPTAAWTDGKAGGRPSVSPSRLQLGGAFAAEQPAAGLWAYGPALTYAFGLSEAFQLRASAMALFGARDQYKDMGLTAGANWDFLRWGQNHYALGVGLFGGYLYESATFTVGTHDYSTTSTPSQSNLEVGLNLRGRLAFWRSLRVVAEGGIRLMSNRIAGPTTIPGDDGVTYPVKSPIVYQRWRPMFSVGLELPM
jgi:hypothetical protein